MTGDIVLDARHLTKSYGGVVALVDGSLQVRAGEVHTLLGENGAGKSTLVKILSGVTGYDSGELLVDGVDVAGDYGAERAAALGVRVVHQHLTTIPHLTVAENLALRNRPRFGLIRRSAERAAAQEHLDRIGISLPLDARAGDLPIAARQVIEIARALDEDARLLVLDEPTASLGEREVQGLFEVMRRLRDQGVAIIFISHKLDEVLEISDRVTVLRDGAHVSTLDREDCTESGLVSHMIGRLAQTPVDRVSQATDEPVLELSSVSSPNGVKNISLTLHRGEVVGVYGLVGSGRTELGRVLIGADRSFGEMTLRGARYRPRSPSHARRAGVGMVPEERGLSVFSKLTVSDNVTVSSPDLIARWSIVKPGSEWRAASKMIDLLRIRTRGPDEPIGALSGGNQQKAVLGRWLMRSCDVLVLDDPTSGVDVGAKREIYQIVSSVTADGTAVLISSSELPELLAVSDRVVVLHRGSIAGVLAGERMTQTEVLHLAVRGTELG